MSTQHQFTRDDLVTLYAAINELYHDRNDTIGALVDCKEKGFGIDETELERLKNARFLASMVRIKLYKALHSEPISEPLRARLHEMLHRTQYHPYTCEDCGTDLKMHTCECPLKDTCHDW